MVTTYHTRDIRDAPPGPKTSRRSVIAVAVARITAILITHHQLKYE